MFHGTRLWRIAVLALAMAAGGCAHRPGPDAPRAFNFERDTFAFANEIYWNYQEDPATGKMTHETRVPRPEYAHRCFVLVRAAKEFRLHAVFKPEEPALSVDEYRDRVRSLFWRSARRPSREGKRIGFPGYADLRSFSEAHERVLKESLGGAWQSYSQRGHWRMLFPFTNAHQRRTAQHLQERLAQGAVAAVHVVRFPELTINHAVLAYAAHADADADVIRFDAYDPNNPGEPIRLVYDGGTGRFRLPATPYYVGGTVDAYEVYRPGLY